MAFGLQSLIGVALGWRHYVGFGDERMAWRSRDDDEDHIDLVCLLSCFNLLISSKTFCPALLNFSLTEDLSEKLFRNGF